MTKKEKEVPKTTLKEVLSKAEPAPRPRGWKAAKTYFTALLGLLLIPVIIGGLVAVGPLLAIAAAVPVVEPAIETWRDLPEELEDVAIAERSYFYDKNGDVFATIWSENRIAVESLDEISPNLVNALVATEDKRFFEHAGIDYVATARAFAARHGGGSGITQQLIKNLRFFNLNNEGGEKEAAVEASVMRKLEEAKLALNYEKTHTKEEILLEYFNTVAVGGPTIYGVETASQYLFGVPASELSIAQAAALVGSINNPTVFNLTDPENTEWVSRKELAIDRMLEEGMITSSEASEAKEEELVFVFKKLPGGCSDSSFPFYCEEVLSELRENGRLGDTPEQVEAALFRGGLHVHTFLDPEATNFANSYLKDSLGDENRVVAPTAVVQPGTGGVLVMAQNRAWGDGPGQTHIVLPETPAGTGSTFKMVTLAAALEQGINVESLNFTPRCPLKDSSIDTPPGGIKNTGSCSDARRPMGFKEATALSSNVWYVELALKAGMNNVIDMADKLGLNNTPGMTSRSGSFPLGVTENSPVDMAAAYATFVNEGIYCPARTVSEISYADGNTVPVPDGYDPAKSACQRVISPHTASVVLTAMKSVVSGEFPNASGNAFSIPNYDTVAKTGTNNLMNTTWVQLSKQYSIYVNAYDMDSPLNGIETIYFRGRNWHWKEHVPGEIGKTILESMLSGQTNQPLNYSATDRTVSLIPVPTRDFITVPSVVGMQPEFAAAVLENLGFDVKIKKERVKVNDSEFPSGVIATQSLNAGSKIPVGSTREIILAINQ